MFWGVFFFFLVFFLYRGHVSKCQAHGPAFHLAGSLPAVVPAVMLPRALDEIRLSVSNPQATDSHPSDTNQDVLGRLLGLTPARTHSGELGTLALAHTLD